MALNTSDPEGDEAMAWISGNRYLSQSEMENNAALIWEFFGSRGWTAQAVAGMLGNMQQESNINPGIWQNLNPYAGGYGLVQWTPYTKYANWAGNQWQDNGQLECQRIIYEMTLPNDQAQWVPTPLYPMTFQEYAASTQSAENLASVWMKNYEKAGDEQEALRRSYAASWYTFITGQPAPPPEPTPDPEPTGQDQVPVWMMFGMNKWQQGFTNGKRFV